jgi:uncharacterized membrane protein YiaA
VGPGGVKRLKTYVQKHPIATANRIFWILVVVGVISALLGVWTGDDRWMETMLCFLPPALITGFLTVAAQDNVEDPAETIFRAEQADWAKKY